MRLICLGVTFFAFIATAWAQQPPVSIAHTQPDFTLKLPPNLVEYAGENKPDALYVYELRDEEGRRTNIFVLVDKVKGQLEQAPLRREDVRGELLSLYTEKWQGFDINVFEIRSMSGRIEMHTRNAAVPLKGNALKVQVSGPASDDQRLDALMKELLAGLDGQTNWLTPEEKSSRIIMPAVGLGVTASVVILLVLVRRRQLRNRRRLSGEAAMHMPH